MEGLAGAGALRMNDRQIGRAAAELLSSQSERRKRGRPPTPSEGSDGAGDVYIDKKQRHQGEAHAGSVNVAAAKKAITALIRDSPTYKRLTEAEERIDVAIMRKQQDIRDALKTHAYTTNRVFRLYLFNTYRSQPHRELREDEPERIAGNNSGDEVMPVVSAPSAPSTPKKVDDGDVPSWSLRIQGQLLPPSQSNDWMKQSSVRSQGEHSTGKMDASAKFIANSNNAAIPSSTDGSEMLNNAKDAVSDFVAQQRANGVHQSTPALVGVAKDSLGPPASNETLRTNDAIPRPNAGSSSKSGAMESRLLRCTEVFKRVVVELDREVYPSDNLIEWNRDDKEPPADGFELSRAGDKECTAQVFLYVDHKPDRFKLSFVLSRLIGVRTDTRSGIFSAVWQYVKKMKLQCTDDKSSVRIDQGLRSLLPAAHVNLATIKLAQLFEVIKMHMGPPDPIQLSYTINLDGNVVDNQACYDIQIEVPDETLKDSAQNAGILGLTCPNSAEFAALSDKHLEAMEQLGHHKRRRDFFEGFCANPVEFINHLILSQTRDLKVIAGSSGRNPEEERKASFYQQQWVHEAIPRYLLRKAVADAAKKNAENEGDHK